MGPVWPRPPPGSSPLARGLQLDLTGRLRGDRIIPARAGFTPCEHARYPRTPDHPRSRGVYKGEFLHHPVYEGSSPLARGLLCLSSLSLRTDRIIPARAGFTWTRAMIADHLSDHPRSRGVYDVFTPGMTLGIRIIPARAGFTHPRCRHGESDQDHPRSRGVYSLTPRPASAQPGSSPLARGLLLVGLTAPC